MSNIIVAPQGQLSVVAQRAMQARGKEADNFGANAGGGYGVVTYKGKVWRLKKGATDIQLLRPDDGTPQAVFDVVIVDSAKFNSKTFYPTGFVEGSNQSPFCWSSNGVTPHSNVPANQRQHSVCATCPMNQVGSKVGEDGKKSRACRNRRRTAVLPAADLENETFGGPMMLGIPAASLGPMGEYAMKLKAVGAVSWAVVTRLGFDLSVAYPKITFAGVRTLNDQEVERVLAWQQDPVIERLLDEDVQPDEKDEPAGQLAPHVDPVAAAFGQPQPVAMHGQAIGASTGVAPAAAPPAGAAPVQSAVVQAPAPAPVVATPAGMNDADMAQFLAWRAAQAGTVAATVHAQPASAYVAPGPTAGAVATLPAQQTVTPSLVTPQVRNVIPLQQPAQAAPQLAAQAAPAAAAPETDVHAGAAPAGFEAALANLLGPAVKA